MSDILIRGHVCGTEIPGVELLKSKYPSPAPSGHVLSLKWGEVAVLENPVPGYAPVTGRNGEMFAVIGRPISVADTGDRAVAEGVASAATAQNRHTHSLYALFQEAGHDALATTLTGEYAIFILEAREPKVTVITDVMNTVRVYWGRDISTGDIAISTQPDVLAEVLKRSDCLDLVAVTDFVVHARTCFPFTFYRGIEQMQPASICHITLNGGDKSGINVRPYWTPEAPADTEWNLRDRAEELRVIFQQAVADAVRGTTRVGVLLSGGMDSRAVLSALPRGLEVTGFTLCDRPNVETEIAKRVAEKARVKWELVFRDPDYYGKNAETAVRLCGHEASLLNSHFVGMRGLASADSTDILLGGFNANTLFRAYYGSRPVRVLGTDLPFRWLCGYSGHVALDAETNSTVRSEITGLFQGPLYEAALQRNLDRCGLLGAHRKDGSEKEWLEIWPRAVDFLEISLHRRLLRKSEVFFDRRLVAASATIPARQKVNDKLYRAAFLPLLGELASIPLSGDILPLRMPIGLHFGAQMLSKGLRKLRGVISRGPRLGSEIKTEGSWINREWYWENSPALLRHRNEAIRNPPAPVEQILRIGLPAFFSSNVSTYLKYRLLHLCIWHKERRSGIESSC